jgi:hypothetical protein
MTESSAEKRLQTLENDLARYRQRVDGWPCSHCTDGWMLTATDLLYCESCGYFRYL